MKIIKAILIILIVLTFKGCYPKTINNSMTRSFESKIKDEFNIIKDVKWKVHSSELEVTLKVVFKDKINNYILDLVYNYIYSSFQDKDFNDNFLNYLDIPNITIQFYEDSKFVKAYDCVMIDEFIKHNKFDIREYPHGIYYYCN